MVDVHIAHMPGQRSDWWDQCHESLRGHPITIHHINGVIGDVRQARFNGYHCGTHEFVAHVDPDDRVLPGAFNAVVGVLQQSPDAAGAYCLSNVLNEKGQNVGLIHPYREYDAGYLSKHVAEIHQIVVMRREPLLRIMRNYWDIIPSVTYCEIVCYALLAREYTWKAVDFVGYEWRVHNRGAHTYDPHTRQQTLHLLKRIHHDIVSKKSK